jgi:hypothetical protein
MVLGLNLEIPNSILMRVLLPNPLGLPLSRDKWFKNDKVENIAWNSLLIYETTKYHVKGTPLDLFHPR